MHLFSVVCLTLCANMDTLFIGFLYRMRHIHISWQNNVILSILTTLGTFLSMQLGSYLTCFLSFRFANHIGAFLLMVIGFIMIFKSFQKDDKGTSLTIQKLSIKQTLLLGISLSFNNMGLSLSGSLTGIPCLLTCVLTFFFSWFFILISQLIGQIQLLTSFEKQLPFLSGFFIFLIGLYELFI
ncbi:MAG: manganese efflux pump MntP family protein [Longibaculum sp.]